MKPRAVIITALILLVLCPLIGGWIHGFHESFFRFPPLVEQLPAHAPFSWPIFMVFLVLSLGALLLYLFPVIFGFSRPKTKTQTSEKHTFPVWGWLGIAVLLTSWMCAWGQFPFLGIFKYHTFFPLWIGYILTMDGLVYHRRGISILSNHRAAFLALFPASAVSWWYFEFLNRFTQNWWYPDRLDFGPIHYIIYSSLCFSTVLPAVFETYEWLISFPALRSRYARGPIWKSSRLQKILLPAGAIILFLTPLLPDPLFFTTWIAPLAILAGALSWAGIRSPFSKTVQGDWTSILNLALAALICGGFWELWNYFSIPSWEYSIPYVSRFPVFAMPVAGFSGYLPFGPICACFWLTWIHLLPKKTKQKLSGLSF